MKLATNNTMLKRSTLSLCVAFALQGNMAWASSVESVEEKTEIQCPTDLRKLTKEQKAKLPAQCFEEKDNSVLGATWEWVGGGAAALMATLGLVSINSDNDNHHGNSGGDTGGDTGGGTGGDTGGDTGGNTGGGTSGDTGGDTGGDTSGDTSGDSGGDTGGNTGGDTGGETGGVTTYSNDVIVDKDTKTLTIDGTVWIVTANGDGTWAMVDPAGEKSVQLQKYEVDSISNTIKLTVFNSDSTKAGVYDYDGELTITDMSNIALADRQSITISGGTASGSGNAGKIVDGSGNNISIGDSTATAEGIGSFIIGNENVISSNGTTSADGTGSNGIEVKGNSNTFTNIGDVIASDGATGIVIQGDKNTITNGGTTTVSSSDKNARSTGFIVNGDGNTLHQTGDLNVGDFSTGLDVSGTGNTVSLESTSINVTGQKATGVNVTGAGNTVTLSGDMTVDKNQKADNAATYFYDPSVGINVTGSNNTVTLDGSLTVVSDTEQAGYSYGDDSGSEENIQGLTVNGGGNLVTLNQGIHLVGETDAIANTAAGNQIANQRKGPVGVAPVSVSGQSTVILRGESTVSGTFPTGTNALFSLENGAALRIEEGASFVTDEASINGYTTSFELFHGDSGSSFTNAGTIETTNAWVAHALGAGSQLSNQGDITINRATSSASAMIQAVMGLAAYSGASAVNASGAVLTGNVLNQRAVVDSMADADVYGVSTFNSGAVSLQAMTAFGAGSSAINDGTINMAGRAVVGMAATGGSSTAVNNGLITTDALWVNPEDTTTLASNIGNRAIDYAVGMAAGADYNSKSGSTAINSGTITVDNAGAGMAAYGKGNTVVNQGTINLDQNENYNSAAPLVGMAVYDGGIAINNTTGVINVNAGNGMAFYNDGSGVIVNYGLVCTSGNCEDADSYNPTDSNVTPAWNDGDVITAQGEKLALTGKALVMNTSSTTDAYVTNAGTVTGNTLIVAKGGHLTNEVTGSINSVTVNVGGEYLNQGSSTTVKADGNFINEGTVTGTATIASGAAGKNTGSINSVVQWSSTFDNSGTVSSWKGSSASAVMNNDAGGTVNKVTFDAASTFNNVGTVNLAGVDKNGVFNNLEGGTVVLKDNSLWSGKFNNWGTVNSDADIATTGAGHTLYNGTTGVINGQVTTSNNNGGSKAINDGTININKTGNVAMSAHGSSKMVNNGTINVGTEGTTQTGMVGMQLESDATTNGVVENNGAINIYASNSYAFSKLGSNGHIVNNGTVYIDDSVTGSGLIKQPGTAMEGSGEGGDGSEVHYVDFTAPVEPTIAASSSSTSTNTATTNDLNGYVVGTSADGSAGKLMVNNASMNGVEVNTGFAAGTAATTVTFDNVVEGNNLTDAGAITSTSVVWSAQGTQDTSGNVDVTMSKNAYTSVVDDNSVNSVATALDAGYTNNELYSSLNMATSSDVTKAMQQLSGSKAVNVSRDARVLSNRFDMLADAAPVMNNGLSFNVVAKGDPRAELSNDTQYDMMALRQKLGFGDNQSLTMEYGIARLDGNGNVSAGQDGITGGYSQFFGLDHALPVGENGLSWNNALRYDVHQLDTKRGINYGNVNKQAQADTKQQYLELRSEGRKTFNVSEGLDVSSYAGVKLRHTMDDGYKETGAGDFNLNMNNATETAVDSVVGMKLSYAGKNGWAATATVEGGPNLSYATSGKTASLQGTAGQSFGVDDGQKGGGINGLAQVGVKYHTANTSASLEAFHWKEDSVSDKGLMVKYKFNF